MEDTVKTILDASPAVVLMVVLNFIGFAVKRIPAIPNWLIPFILPVLGGLAYPYVGEFSPAIKLAKHPAALMVLYGVGIGCAAVGVNQALKQYAGRASSLLTGGTGNTDTITKPVDPPADAPKP